MKFSKKLWTNDIDLPCCEYAVILGLTPSKGARSPFLWNSSFKAGKIDVMMIPLDITSSNILSVLNYLQGDLNCIGGAITSPYKETVARWLGKDHLTKEASDIGSVNCIFRDKNNFLIGTNTDGEAACRSLNNAYGSLKNKSILQLGCGGAGKATAVYFKNSGANVTICVRDLKKNLNFTKQNLIPTVCWSQLTHLINNFDIVINTTTIGSKAMGNEDICPISEDQIKLMKKEIFVYDIIYDPNPTKLLYFAKKNGLDVLNGTEMNIEQAALSFMYAIKGKYIMDYEDVKKIMYAQKL